MYVSLYFNLFTQQFTFPWEKQIAGAENSATVGALVVYKVSIDTNTGAWQFDRMWTRTFNSQTNVLHWCSDNETLYVGLDSGAVHQLVVPKEFNYMRYQEVSLRTFSHAFRTSSYSRIPRG